MIEEIGQLRGRDRHHAVGDGGPQEPPALQTLHEQTRAVAVMPDQLDQVASPPPEDPQIAGMRICDASHIRIYVSDVDMCRPGLGAADSAALSNFAAT